VTLQGAIDDQHTGIDVSRDQSRIVPSGDAFALNDFRDSSFLRSAGASGQSMAGRTAGLLKPEQTCVHRACLGRASISAFLDVWKQQCQHPPLRTIPLVSFPRR